MDQTKIGTPFISPHVARWILRSGYCSAYERHGACSGGGCVCVTSIHRDNHNSP